MSQREGSSSGKLGSYLWAEDWDADSGVAEVVEALRERLAPLYGLCLSWDSGLLKPEWRNLEGWSVTGAYALSPPVGQVEGVWPNSSCGWDEWYFFRQPPQLRGRMRAFCNWGLSVGQAQDLVFWPGGMDLSAQLERHEPEVVIGDGPRVFILSRMAEDVQAFQALGERRRTMQ